MTIGGKVQVRVPTFVLELLDKIVDHRIGWVCNATFDRQIEFEDREYEKIAKAMAERMRSSNVKEAEHGRIKGFYNGDGN